MQHPPESPGAKLEFATSDGTSQTGEVRMTIESNGRVNIATVLKLTPGTAPGTPEEGDIYYDSSENKVKVYTGSSWENLN